MEAQELCSRSKKEYILFWAVVMAAALVMRVIGCFWGFPMLLHPDEPATVDYAIEMLSRHSYMAVSFDRPDHFEIKCDALLFTVFSWLRYQMPAYEAFSQHPTFFYGIARLFTAFFGTLLIPVTAGLTHCLFYHKSRKFQRVSAVVAGMGAAFLPVFLQYSCLAVPDLVLTVFVMLFTWCLWYYLREGRKWSVWLAAGIIGICVTIKYNGAILCLPIALAVIYRKTVTEKRPVEIFSMGIVSAALVCLTAFLIAPNLFIEYKTVIANVLREARPNHLGADGLSLFGNMRYYFLEIASECGYISILFGLLGLFFVLRDREKGLLCFLVGGIYWFCMSVLKLHWSRWGIPMYPFYLILVGSGVAGLLEISKGKKAAQWLVGLAAAAMLGNMFLSGLAETTSLTVPDSRYLALEQLEELGITEENTLSEGYTPFDPAGYQDRTQSFFWEDGQLRVEAAFREKTYFVMSDSFQRRFRAEPERYGQQLEIYDGIGQQFPLVYQLIPDDTRESSPFVLKNIAHALRYMGKHVTCSGNPITVYSLPEN